jgi:hypothetical protein
MHCYEQFNPPLEAMSTEDVEEIRKSLGCGEGAHWGPRFRLFPGGAVEYPHDIFSRIEEFSKRSITYPADRLYAFIGILDIFETGLLHIRNYWGTPILPERPFQASLNGLNVTEHIYPQWEYLSALCWEANDLYPTRNDTFPSWSWIGWNGDIEFVLKKMASKGTSRITSTITGVEVLDGEILNWEEYHNLYPKLKNPLSLSHFVHISADTVQVQYCDEFVNWRMYMDDGCYILVELAINVTSLREEEEFNGLILAASWDQPEETPEEKSIVLFIMWVAEIDGSMERVGGRWLSSSEPLYDAKDKCLGGGHKEGDDDHILTSRYGEHWNEHLVSTMQTFRLR